MCVEFAGSCHGQGLEAAERELVLFLFPLGGL
jgi:hypothetical protein